MEEVWLVEKWTHRLGILEGGEKKEVYRNKGLPEGRKKEGEKSHSKDKTPGLCRPKHHLCVAYRA